MNVCHVSVLTKGPTRFGRFLDFIDTAPRPVMLPVYAVVGRPSSYYLLPPLIKKSTTQSGKVTIDSERRKRIIDKTQPEIVNGNMSYNIPKSSSVRNCNNEIESWKFGRR